MPNIIIDIRNIGLCKNSSLSSGLEAMLIPTKTKKINVKPIVRISIGRNLRVSITVTLLPNVVSSSILRTLSLLNSGRSIAVCKWGFSLFLPEHNLLLT